MQSKTSNVTIHYKTLFQSVQSLFRPFFWRQLFTHWIVSSSVVIRVRLPMAALGEEHSGSSREDMCTLQLGSTSRIKESTIIAGVDDWTHSSINPTIILELLLLVPMTVLRYTTWLIVLRQLNLPGLIKLGEKSQLHLLLIALATASRISFSTCFVFLGCICCTKYSKKY